MRTAVIISHYDERAEEPLDYLLWQLEHIEAGAVFDTFVVVNRDQERDVQIASKYEKVRFIYRPNAGYNIGAWDHGWRSCGDYGFIVFLQDECLVARKGWLHAYMRKAGDALLGEALVDPAETWEESQRSYEEFYRSKGIASSEWDDATGTRNTPNNIRRFLRQKGIEPQPTMRHLRSLILACPRSLLVAIDGFPLGLTYRDAVAAEVGISQKALAAGFRIKQAGLLPFSYVIHPQWMTEYADARSLSGATIRIRSSLLPATVRLALKRRITDKLAIETAHHA